MIRNQPGLEGCSALALSAATDVSTLKKRTRSLGAAAYENPAAASTYNPDLILLIVVDENSELYETLPFV
jgi:hypothetical protein